MRKFILLVVGIFVVIVVALIFYVRFFTVPKPVVVEAMTSLIPAKIEGWKVEDIPLAETAGMQSNINKVLQFDEFVFRAYTKGNRQILIYGAYWAPGERAAFDAGGHNPDSCWVNFGWTRKAREYSCSNKIVDGRKLQPFEYGIYEKDGQSQSVLFWHLVNGKVYSYDTKQLGWKDGIAGAIERIPLRIEDIKRLGLNQRREQMFIRISTMNADIKDFLEDEDFQKLLSKCDGLGIFEDRPWGTPPKRGLGSGD